MTKSRVSPVPGATLRRRSQRVNVPGAERTSIRSLAVDPPRREKYRAEVSVRRRWVWAYPLSAVVSPVKEYVNDVIPASVGVPDGSCRHDTRSPAAIATDSDDVPTIAPSAIVTTTEVSDPLMRSVKV